MTSAVEGVPRMALLLVPVLAALAACQPAAPAGPAPDAGFATGEARIETAADTFRLAVEIAETERQMEVGLKRRDHLPEDAGMLFLFDREQRPDEGFWMFRTRIPLSIAFLDAEGRIVALRDMAPCRSPFALFCRRYAPGVPYHAALEVNQGYFARRGIGVGDRVVVRREGSEGHRN